MSKTAVDLSEFERYQVGKRRRCKVDVARKQLNSDALTLLNAALDADPLDISAGAVCLWLEKEHGVEGVSPNSVLSHRQRKCSCYGGS